MTTSKTAQQAIADLSETLEYSIECGYVQHAAVRWLRDRHVAARDANAAELAALREQVAQLTRQLDDTRAGAARRRAEVEPLRGENARLTEQVAAAERLADSRLKSFTDAYAAIEHLKATVVDKEIAYDMAASRAARAESSAEAAERDRDAARALLRQWRGLYAGRLLPGVLARQTDDHLSGQPAAPSRTEAESELAALRERVARAESILLGPGDNWCQSALRALEVLRGS